MKSILYLTGTRADFGKLKPLIRETSKEYKVNIFATGMHMLEKYGMTCKEITKSGFEYYPFINQDNDTPMDQVLANTIQGLGYYLRENPTNLLVVHGDRVEALAGACVGALNNVLVAHIEGGEISGTIDESIRHAVTKLAHVHFVANTEAENRLKQMGEDNIFVIGSPDIDIMLSDLPDLEEVKDKYAIEYRNYAICIYHPVTTEQVDLSLFDALEESENNYIVIYPNNDTGSNRILNRIDRLEGKNFKVLPSMRFEYFLTMLKHADFIIGNSSVGIREAPVFGIPTIDVGSRQEGRCTCPSIVNCRTPEEIRHAIEHLPKAVKSFHFGRGDSAKRFMEALPDVWDISPQKRFIDR